MINGLLGSGFTLLKSSQLSHIRVYIFFSPGTMEVMIEAE